MPERLRQLEHWLGQSCGLSDASWRRRRRMPASGATFASPCADGSTLVAMDAPPDKEDCRPFVEVAGRLAQGGAACAAYHAQDLAQGFLLLEDLGADRVPGRGSTRPRPSGSTPMRCRRIWPDAGRGLGRRTAALRPRHVAARDAAVPGLAARSSSRSGVVRGRAGRCCDAAFDVLVDKCAGAAGGVRASRLPLAQPDGRRRAATPA